MFINHTTIFVNNNFPSLTTGINIFRKLCMYNFLKKFNVLNVWLRMFKNEIFLYSTIMAYFKRMENFKRQNGM